MRELKIKVTDGTFLSTDDYNFYPGEPAKTWGLPDSRHEGSPPEIEIHSLIFKVDGIPSEVKKHHFVQLLKLYEESFLNEALRIHCNEPPVI